MTSHAAYDRVSALTNIACAGGLMLVGTVLGPFVMTVTNPNGPHRRSVQSGTATPCVVFSLAVGWLTKHFSPSQVAACSRRIHEWRRSNTVVLSSIPKACVCTSDGCILSVSRRRTFAGRHYNDMLTCCEIERPLRCCSKREETQLLYMYFLRYGKRFWITSIPDINSRNARPSSTPPGENCRNLCSLIGSNSLTETLDDTGGFRLRLTQEYSFA